MAFINLPQIHKVVHQKRNFESRTLLQKRKRFVYNIKFILLKLSLFLENLFYFFQNL